MRELRLRKPVIVCGDFNTTLSDQDIYPENKWAEQSAEGFQTEERENLLRFLGDGFLDCYRLLHPEETEKYTWWSNRRFKRKENRGWRLDYFFASTCLKDSVREASVLNDIMGSDHCPISLEIDVVSQKPTQISIRPSLHPVCTYDDLRWMKSQGYNVGFVKHSDMSFLWNSIDWEGAEERLREMQRALAKSAYTHDWELITKWQKRIVYSIDAKVIAVRHVCSTNSGSGVDCIKWSTPHEKMAAALSLTSKDYRAMPSRLLLIRSKNGKQRKVHIETFYDRAMQTLYAFSLDPVAESWGDRKSFAYRKGRSAYDLNEYILSSLSGADAPEWLFVGDVHQCYGNLSHKWILDNIPTARGVLQEFLKAGYVFAGELFPMETGIGIGCAMSPIIANMALDGLQEHIFSQMYPSGARDYANGNLLRYADDILVTARTREDAQKIKEIVEGFLKERGLELSKEKTHIIHIQNGFTYMSRSYYKRGIQAYCEPSEKSVERFMESVRDLITDYNGSQKSLIDKLNRKIDGFASYHKVSEAAVAFRKLDVYIEALLLELCEAKHPKWDRKKILEKYWYVEKNGRHRYALTDKKEVRVKFLSDTLFVKYKPVRTGVNPYIHTEYVEERSQERKIRNMTGIYRSIWNRQQGRCYFCGKKILKDDEKTVVEVDFGKTNLAARSAYVHLRCTEGSIEYIDTDSSPASLTDIMNLLESLSQKQKPTEQRFFALSQYFRACRKNSVTLTFQEIEEINGRPLGAAAQRKEFWYRTGFSCISQCWLENGYEINHLHLEGKQRVVFHVTSEGKKTASVRIPDVIKYGRIPEEAKYELENYFSYIIKKYAL